MSLFLSTSSILLFISEEGGSVVLHRGEWGEVGGRVCECGCECGCELCEQIGY
jgi:hypothetical protein